MRAETRKRIEAEIKRLGYRPHAMARSLRLAKQLFDRHDHHRRAAALSRRPLHHPRRGGAQQPAQFARLWPAAAGPGAARLPQFLAHPRHPQRCDLHHDVGPDTVRRGIVEALLALGQPLVVFQDILRSPTPISAPIRQADDEGGRMVGDEVLRLGARRAGDAGARGPLAGDRRAGQGRARGDPAHGARRRAADRGVRRCANFDDTQAALDRDIAGPWPARRDHRRQRSDGHRGDEADGRAAS